MSTAAPGKDEIRAMLTPNQALVEYTGDAWAWLTVDPSSASALSRVTTTSQDVCFADPRSMPGQSTTPETTPQQAAIQAKLTQKQALVEYMGGANWKMLSAPQSSVLTLAAGRDGGFANGACVRLKTASPGGAPGLKAGAAAASAAPGETSGGATPLAIAGGLLLLLVLGLLFAWWRRHASALRMITPA
jgi:hypothetical protein